MSNENGNSRRREALLGDRDGSYAIARHVRMSPTKVRRVIDLVRTDAEPMWHETPSIDFVYVAHGRCTFLSAAGAIVLAAGDTIVVRGGQHAWVNHDAEPCRLVDVSVAVPEPSDVTLAWPDPPAAD